MINSLPQHGIRRDLDQFRGDRFRVEGSHPWVARRKVMNLQRVPGEPVTVLLFDRQIHAPTNTRYTRIVRRIETHQAVQDLGTIEIAFDPFTQKLLIHAISIFRDGALKNHAEESAFELFQRESGLERDIISGAITSLLVLKDLRIGDVLDIEFSICSDSGLFQDHYWFTELVGNTYAIGRQWFSWIEREGQKLFVQAPDDTSTFTREESDSGTVRTWFFDQPPIVALENDIPVTHKPFPEIAITTFENWSEVVSVFLQPWSAMPCDVEELEQALEPIRQQAAADPMGAVAAAIDLVRHQVRYLGYSPGIFAHVPADPAQVWNRRFGDCKEKSRLLCWMLDCLGVEAVPVLVNTSSGAALNDLLPSPGVFDHVVVRIRIRETELWVDPTDVSRRGRVDSWNTLPFHFGLPLMAGTDRLVAIPQASNETPGIEVEEIIKVEAKSRGATITITHIYRGADADGVRHALDARGRSAVTNHLQEQVRQTRPDATLEGELGVIDDPVENFLTLRCEFHCGELLRETQAGDADLLFLVPYSIPPWIIGVPAKRKYPLALRHPVHVKHTIRVNSDDPRNTRIPGHTVASEFFMFSFVSTSGRADTVHRFTYQSKLGTVPAEKTQRYAADLAQVSEGLNWHLRFRPRKKRSYPSRGISNSPDNW